MTVADYHYPVMFVVPVKYLSEMLEGECVVVSPGSAVRSAGGRPTASPSATWRPQYCLTGTTACFLVGSYHCLLFLPSFLHLKKIFS